MKKEHAKLTCVKCSNEQTLYYDEKLNETLAKHSLCHSCNFWVDGVARINRGEVIVCADNYRVFNISNGISYQSSSYLGCGGAMMAFRPKDTSGPWIVSNNCWSMGDVPKLFQDYVETPVYDVVSLSYMKLDDLAAMASTVDGKRVVDNEHFVSYYTNRLEAFKLKGSNMLFDHTVNALTHFINIFSEGEDNAL